MKTSNKLFLVFYITAACFFIIYIFTSVRDCEAYWMHDLSITITKQKLYGNISYLFLLPFLIILAQLFFRIKTPVILFSIHSLSATLAFSSLIFAINKPVQQLSDGQYMFISAPLVLSYYIFNIISIIVIAVLLLNSLKFLQKRSVQFDKSESKLPAGRN